MSEQMQRTYRVTITGPKQYVQHISHRHVRSTLTTFSCWSIDDEPDWKIEVAEDHELVHCAPDAAGWIVACRCGWRMHRLESEDDALDAFVDHLTAVGLGDNDG